MRSAPLGLRVFFNLVFHSQSTKAYVSWPLCRVLSALMLQHGYTPLRHTPSTLAKPEFNGHLTLQLLKRPIGSNFFAFSIFSQCIPNVNAIIRLIAGGLMHVETILAEKTRKLPMSAWCAVFAKERKFAKKLFKYSVGLMSCKSPLTTRIFLSI